MRYRPEMTRRGFSLVELMIVVAILGILASIAVPAYNLSVLRAKRAEAPAILQGVGQSEVAYFNAHDAWVTAESNPGGSIGKTARAWDMSKTGWSSLGFQPDGHVRCSYMVTLFNSGGWARADAYCDVDDDNSSYILRNYIPSKDAAQTFQGFREVDGTKY